VPPVLTADHRAPCWNVKGHTRKVREDHGTRRNADDVFADTGRIWKDTDAPAASPRSAARSDETARMQSRRAQRDRLRRPPADVGRLLDRVTTRNCTTRDVTAAVHVEAKVMAELGTASGTNGSAARTRAADRDFAEEDPLPAENTRQGSRRLARLRRRRSPHAPRSLGPCSAPGLPRRVRQSTGPAGEIIRPPNRPGPARADQHRDGCWRAADERGDGEEDDPTRRFRLRPISRPPAAEQEEVRRRDAYASHPLGPSSR